MEKSTQLIDSKKAPMIGVIVFSVILLLLGGIYFYTRVIKDVTLTDALRFKQEYELINGQAQEGSTKTHMSITLPEKNPMVYSSMEQIMKLLENGTGVIYFGFPECPWCRSALPTLFSAANEVGIDKIYYFNALSIRDKKHLDENGTVITDKEGTKEYRALLEKLKDVLNPYDGLNDDSIKRLYFPTVLFVKDGKVLSMHESTVESQADPYTTLTEAEQKELKNIYMEGMRKTLLCEDAC